MGNEVDKTTIIHSLSGKQKLTEDERLTALIDSLEQHDITLKRLEEKVDFYTSRGYYFRVGLSRTISTALGATIGIAFVIFMINWFINNIDIPVIHQILQLILDNLQV